MLRRQPVGKINYGKSHLRQVHGVILVDILIPVNPAASMYADNDRKIFGSSLFIIDIKFIPYKITAVGNIVKPQDI